MSTYTCLEKPLRIPDIFCTGPFSLQVHFGTNLYLQYLVVKEHNDSFHLFKTNFLTFGLVSVRNWIKKIAIMAQARL